MPKTFRKAATVMVAKSILNDFSRMIKAITASCHFGETTPHSQENIHLLSTPEKKKVLKEIGNNVATANALIAVAHIEGSYFPLKGSREEIIAFHYSFVKQHELNPDTYPLHEHFSKSNRRQFSDMKIGDQLIGGLLHYIDTDQWVIYAADKNLLDRYTTAFGKFIEQRQTPDPPSAQKTSSSLMNKL